VSLRIENVRFARLIPVYRMDFTRAGEPLAFPLAIATPSSAARYLYCPNSEVILKRKTKEVVQINLYSVSDDSSVRSTAGSPASTYREELGDDHLTVLKKVRRGGRLVKWNDRDGFNPFRFNPDLIETSYVRALSRKAS
jgi:hypothetical protein